MTDDITTLRIRIEGRVQGVGFREFVVREANARRLRGWVRNRSDGSVEAIASGPTKVIESLILACTKGPESAKVANIDLSPAEPPDQMGFVHRPTL